MSITAPRPEVTLDTETIETIAALEAEVATNTPVTRATITWTESDAGLWVANYGGYFGGTVDKQGAHYFVSDTFGAYVGDFRSLEQAQSHLATRLHMMLPNVIHTL
jgi:hypothetical protein